MRMRLRGRGQTGAQSLNDAYVDAGPAAKAQSIVNEAFLGTQPDADLGRLISGLGRSDGTSLHPLRLTQAPEKHR